MIASTWDVRAILSLSFKCPFLFAKSLIMNALFPQREHGWRTMKRPGIEYFIGYLSQFYEVVVFTSQYAYVSVVLFSIQMCKSKTDY